MTDFNLQQTTFHIEKIRTAVNVGRRSAYQIVTVPGRSLGRIGKITHYTLPESANEEFRSEHRPVEADTARFFWFRRALATLKP